MKQTEQLLKNGYITSRGKAYASGTAYNETYTKHYNWTGTQNTSDSFNKTSKNLSDAADKVSDAADDFRETFDWIEVRLEEINEKLSLKEAKLENAVSSESKNKIIDSMIKDNQEMYDTLIAGANKYYAHANKILMDADKIPPAYRAAAQNGAIAIEEFVGEVGEETLNAIQEYREWVQKGADLTQQAEETQTNIASLARQKFDNTEERWDLKVATRDDKNAKIEVAIDLAEAKGKPISDVYYDQLIANTKNKRGRLVKKRDAMQADLDKAIKLGDIKKYSNEWYEMVSAISGVDEEIIQCNVDIEDFKNEMDNIRWDNLDTVIERLDNVSDEAQSLIDILSEKDLVDENGAWTNQGIASLGLYAQEMENAKLKAAEYADGIYDLQQQYDSGAISESEYNEKLAELKKGQYDSIKAYNDSKKAIVDLQKTRVEAIKKGIDKEVEAYQELIEKKKEALDSEKDLHDFRNSMMDKQKDISEIERKLAALEGDNSMAAQAQKARLRAELAEAKAEQEEMYYDRSVSNQQEALDKEAENFKEEKDAEKEKWDEWLEDTTAVVGNAFETLQTNAETVNATLIGLADEYGLKLSDAIIKPWEDGQTTMDAYWSSFTTLGSDAITALDEELDSFVKAWEKAQDDAHTTLEQQNQQQQTYTQAEYQDPKKPTGGNNGGGGNGGGNTGTPKVGSSVTVKKTATNFGSKSGGKKMASFVPGGSYTVYEISGSGANAQVLIGKNGAYTGWVKLSDLTGYTAQSGNGNNGNPGNNTQYTTYTVKSGDTLSHIALDKLGSASKWKEIYELNKKVIGNNPNKIRVGQKLKIPKYAKGTLGIDEDQFAWIDELGEELQLVPDGHGRLAYLQKGTAILNSDMTERLMNLAMDPTEVLSRSMPQIGISPSVVNNTMEIKVDASVGTLLHVENLNGDNPEEIAKIVSKEFEKHTRNLNNSLRKYVR